ncbi:pentatricopeptide repeat-containing protein [Tripterygium wilfordii]|uniref:Pentatricopeptide repeat-containing protein n=1 Tax=Tripterygium wilfordii TaxID=458696 RepID=A0A7J7D5H7_TRIWF|nr:pentatricopeptide repeat-containing protein At1g26900, mitochondrial [Tripterygium wilfordii]KAF5741590.1 pentatricopeptide repeat-containing protein [Tripterygium wilfordii]
MSSRYHKLISILTSCKHTYEVSQIHGYMVKTGIDKDVFALSKLLASSIRDTEYAASIFNHIENPNLFMFNTMLRGYSVSENPMQAFGLFKNLRAQGFLLDQFSFITTLKASTRELAIEIGLGIHGVVLRSGHVYFLNLRNTLLHFYCECGKIGDAHKLFDEFPQDNDSVSWNTLMDGYISVSKPAMVVDLFRQMCTSCVRFTLTTVLNVLSALGEVGDSLGGDSLHGHCIKTGFSLDLIITTVLIDMYAKTGHIDSGRKAFDQVDKKDVILWNCMIDKYAKCGRLEESVALLQLMKRDRLKPNSSTLAGLLSACAATGSIQLGRCLQDYIKEEGLALDVILGTALVDMYAKCGFLENAIDIFERMKSKDVKSWTAMISGYGFHGQARNAIDLFYRMEKKCYRPNEVTFLAVLTACSHGGLVMEGMRCFEKMIRGYGFSPNVEHYGCLIDMLGRAGMLEEAHDLINSLPIRCDATAWRALLAACRVCGNVELGEYVNRVLVEIDEEHPTDSILLSSTYAITGRLAERTRMQEMKEEIDKEAVNGSVKKEAGWSMIEMDGQGLHV